MLYKKNIAIRIFGCPSFYMIKRSPQTGQQHFSITFDIIWDYVTIFNIIRQYSTLNNTQHYSKICGIIRHFSTIFNMFWKFNILFDKIQSNSTFLDSGIKWKNVAAQEFYRSIMVRPSKKVAVHFLGEPITFHRKGPLKSAI